MTSNKLPAVKLMAAALALSCAASGTAQAAVSIIIRNVNTGNIGFNDTTPAAPVGGNNGTTLGEQRMIAFQHAAEIWGATLTSAVPIVINAQFSPLACTSTTATLGSAGTASYFRDFPGAPRAGTFYPYALTNKLYGFYAAGSVAGPTTGQINANFNSMLGQPGCLDNTYFYLGLDNNHGSSVDFVTVLLHEMGHGVGFATGTRGDTGRQLGATATPNSGFPHAWDYYLLDNTTGKAWASMTDAERIASSLKPSGLSWTGARVTAATANVLGAAGRVNVYGANAGAAAHDYVYGDASFGPPLRSPAVVGQVMPAVEAGDVLSQACTPLSATNASAVRGNIALVIRGTCGFAIKAKVVQDAGAIGMIVADNQPGTAIGMSGDDPAVVIPSVRISQADGVTLKSSLSRRTRSSSGVVASLGLSTSGLLAGADSSGRITMYTPNPFISGSSVSHFNTSATRNQLMEPNINGDLTHSPTLPLDLTFELLKDIGW